MISIYYTELSEEYHSSQHDQALRLLEQAAGRRITDSQLTAGAHGKPSLPSWNGSFNLSHCPGLAVCAADPDGGRSIGIDAELVRPFHENLISRVCSPSEQELLAAVPAGRPRDLLFFRLWTLKESAVKCSGEGLTVPLRSIAFTQKEMQIRCTRPGLHFFQKMIHQDYVISLCSDMSFTEPALISSGPVKPL